MNKVMLLATIVTICFFSKSSSAQSEEYTDLTTWLSKYYCEQNNVEWVSTSDPRYDELKRQGEGMFALPRLTLIDDMYKKIRVEFPMDPALQSTITALENQKNASYLAIAQRYGYSSWDALWNNMKSDPNLQNVNIYEETRVIDEEYTNAYSSATNEYYGEFQKRYEAAVIEAIKRIQNNSEAMNAQN